MYTLLFCKKFCLVLVGPPFTLHFRVRFYAAEPQDLSEELTRYAWKLRSLRLEGQFLIIMKQVWSDSYTCTFS